MRPLGLLGAPLSGAPPFAALGTGVPDATKFLRGDGAWMPMAASNWEFVTSGPIGTGASCAITSAVSGMFVPGYDYEFIFANFGCASASGSYSGFSLGYGGSSPTWDSANHYSCDFGIGSGALAGETWSNAGHIRFGMGVPVAGATQQNARIYLMDPSRTELTYPGGFWTVFEGASQCGGQGAFNYNRASAITGLRLIYSNGVNLTGGTYTVRRCKRS